MKQYIITERTDLFDVSMMIVMRAEIKGSASKETIRSAFDRAVGAHEILSSKTVLSGDGKAYYEKSAPAQSITFTDEEQDEIIAREERTRFKTEQGEFLRAHCIKHTAEGLTMLFCMHHLGGDGKSLIYFIETFMQALDEQELDFRVMRRAETDSLPPESKLSFANSMFVRYFNKHWQKERRVFGFDELDKAFSGFWSTRSTRVQEKLFDSETTKKILADCKKGGVRLTSYITAVMIKNMGGKRSVGYAVDSRTDGNRSMGNQATGISVDAGYDGRKSLVENAAGIQLQMKKKLDDPRKKWLMLRFYGELDGTLSDAVNMLAAGAFSSRAVSAAAEALGYGKKVKDLSITNLTRLDIPTVYSGFSIEGVSFIPPVVSYAKNVVGIVTANGCMRVTLHTFSDNTLTLDELLEGLV